MNHKLDVDMVVVVSDPHAGSSYGLMPNPFTTIGGQVIRPNALQRWLLACWHDFWAWSDTRTSGLKWAFVLNGDATEGVHHRTTEVISADTGDHMAAAVELLAPIAERADHTFIVEGTECHTSNLEHAIGDKLGAVKCRMGSGHSLHAWPQLSLNVNGCCGIIRHHISTTTRPYLEATQLSVQLGVDRIESIRAGTPAPRFLVSAHRHQYGHYSDGDAVSVVCPPWQGLTRHGRKVVPAATTRVGGVILDFREAGPDEKPQIMERIYKP